MRRFVVAGLIIGVAACGPAESPTVTITMSEWAVVPVPSDIVAGPATFELINGGILLHEIVVLRTEERIDALPVADGMVALDLVDGAVIGELGEITGGETLRAELTLEPGAYVLICNIPGHYSAGMRASLAVAGNRSADGT